MTAINTNLIPALNATFDLTLPESLTYEQLQSQLAEKINHLINTDFEKLVYYLYRIDVNEDKMRQLLVQKDGENAAGLIADLVIERQLQKIKTKSKFSADDSNIPDDEKW